MSEDIKEKDIAEVVSDNAAVTDNESAASDKQSDKTRPSRARYIALSIVFGVLFVLGITLISLSIWYKNNYFLEFKELLYVLTGPLEGTGGGMITEILWATVPYALSATVIYTVAVILLTNRKKLFKKPSLLKWLKRGGAILCSFTLVFSLVFTAYSFRFNTYFSSMRESTDIYENYYVDPLSVNITASGKTKNLIYIYVESLETTHALVENGGFMTEDYMPNLTKLAQENLTFTSRDEGKLGGFRTVTGSGWTIAALLATTSAIPYAFSVGSNDMDKVEYFAPGLTNLGDVLESKGYVQEFLCGSDASFAGRDKLFTQHGNYEIYDLSTARSDGYLPSPFYHNMWWGFEDKYLFEIAKDELTELAAGDQPFNLTLLTVDTHPQEGYICDLCGDEYEETTANVLKCTDKQVSEFIDWCKQQDFYEDTVIIITGDHARHDNSMVDEVNYAERTIYNCFINAAIEPSGATSNRVWTSFDMFPTTLAAMGFNIEGNRLGLGVNMFSSYKTLAEQMGFDALNDEMNKFSEFYLMNFSYTGEEEEA